MFFIESKIILYSRLQQKDSLMDPNKEKIFNKAFNVFLVVGMLVAVSLTTVMNFKEPGRDAFMLLLAAACSVAGVLSTVMSANGNILTFAFGFIDVLIGTIIYYENGIMGNFALHAFYFLPMQFIGFWQWSRRGARVKSSKGEAKKVKARRLTRRQWLFLSGAMLVGITVLYFILLFVDNTKLEAGKILEQNKLKILLDAIVMAANIAGQVLMSLAFMEQWYMWMIVNISSVSLWIVALVSPDASSTAAVMAVKYSFYLLNVLNGIRIWLTLSNKEEQVLDNC